jgi:hypothetical protein
MLVCSRLVELGDIYLTMMNDTNNDNAVKTLYGVCPRSQALLGVYGSCPPLLARGGVYEFRI